MTRPIWSSRRSTASRRLPSRLASCAFLLALAALGACGSASSHESLAGVRPAQAAPGSRIIVILMENEEASSVIGSRDAPFLNRLARRYTTATRFYGTAHPSLPNYLALTGGSTFGIDSDCTSCRVSQSNLVDQLESSGVSWRAYMNAMPRACSNAGSSGNYAKKHDPFMYYDDIRTNRARCADVVPGSQLTKDLATGLPSFVWITPDLCQDMHDCSVHSGDKYLARTVPKLLPTLGPNGALFVLWDEGSSDKGCCRLAHGGRIPAVFAGPAVRRGYRLATPVDHYSVLRAIEDSFGASHLRDAACSCTPSLAGAFSAPLSLKKPSPG